MELCCPHQCQRSPLNVMKMFMLKGLTRLFFPQMGVQGELELKLILRKLITSLKPSCSFSYLGVIWNTEENDKAFSCSELLSLISNIFNSLVSWVNCHYRQGLSLLSCLPNTLCSKRLKDNWIKNFTGKTHQDETSLCQAYPREEHQD